MHYIEQTQIGSHYHFIETNNVVTLCVMDPSVMLAYKVGPGL